MSKERTFREHSICSCGRNSAFFVGARDFFIGTRKITVKNVPHFYCSYCDKASYSSDVHVDEVLKYAYRNGLNEIDYK